MKRDSKMSVLRIVVATLVGVLCFSFAGMGQTQTIGLEGWNDGINKFGWSGNDYVFTVKMSSSWMNVKIAVNGTNTISGGYTFVGNGLMQVQDQQYTVGNSAPGLVYVRVNPTDKVVEASNKPFPPSVPKIVDGASNVCLNTNPKITNPSLPSAYSSYEKGWEIKELGLKFTSLSGTTLTDASGNTKDLSEFYGYTLAYYVIDGNGLTGYSNGVKIMSVPEIEEIEGVGVCPDSKLEAQPPVIKENGAKLKTSDWRVAEKTGSFVSAKNLMLSDNYKYVKYAAGNQCGTVSTTRKDLVVYPVSTLSFTSTPSSVLCSQSLSTEVQLVDVDGNNITEQSNHYYWTRNGSVDYLTSVNTHAFSFDCDNESGNVVLGAYTFDLNGCKSVATPINVNVNSTYKTYTYIGGTGSASDLTNKNNWKDASGQHPSNFTSPMCKYIINVDGVELLAGQTWNVGGEGTRIVVGDGTWYKNFTSPVYSFNPDDNNYGITGSYLRRDKVEGANWILYMSTIGSTDFRSQSKKMKISGILNTNDNVSVDVRAGSSLTIATSSGNFKIGNQELDKVPAKTGDANMYYNVCVVPGASVTYTGDGTKKIRSGIYSQLYIENVTGTASTVFEKDAIVEVKQSLNLTTGNNTTQTDVDPNGATIVYSGSIDQTIARMDYYNLSIKNSSKKTSSKTIWIENTLEVSAASEMVVKNSLYLYGSGDSAMINNGTITCTTNSNVCYVSFNPTTVASANYYNLDLGRGDRTFSTSGIIGVAGTLTKSTKKHETKGSTVEFNGSVTQTIPAFDFYNLTINNTQGTNNAVSLSGDVTVAGMLSLQEGILNTNGKSLNITNTSTGAVSAGYRVKADSASYVYGKLTRALPSGASGSDYSSFLFPIGDGDSYMPLTMKNVKTSTNPSVSVEYTTASGNYSSPLTGIKTNSNSAWKVTGTNYTSASMDVSTTDGLGDYNTIAFKSGSSNFINEFGTKLGTSVLGSDDIQGSGIVALGKRNISEKTYYYNCTGDPSSPNSWFTGKNGSGTKASSFAQDDAKWYFTCDAIINQPFSITGKNSKVYFDIPMGSVVTINNDFSAPTAEHVQGKINVGKKGSFTIFNSYTMDDVSGKDYGLNRTTLVNDGSVDVYNSVLSLSDSYVENNGNMNFHNTDINISSTFNQGEENAENAWNTSKEAHTQFINNGMVRVNSGNVNVSGWKVRLRNSSGAVWYVDNTTTPSKTVKFDGVEFWDKDMMYVYFECGSSFVVKNSDVEVQYVGNDDGCHAYLEGELTVYDGDLRVQRKSPGGGNFTVKDCGKIYMIDTDGNGDGLLKVNGSSGWQVNVEGTIYAVGIINESNGSGNKFNVVNGAEVFVGDIGVGSSSNTKTWDFSVDVKTGGTMNYCGNRTSGADGIGSNSGTLNYAGSFYEGSAPKIEGDISGDGTQNLMYVDGSDCMKAYTDVATHNTGSTLLPIELTVLYGICKDNVVEIHWQTVSETGNEVFEVLRSFDGVNFEEIGSLLGAGTTTDVQNYVYFDTDEDKTGIVYYKLRQVDFDKKSVESKIIAVQTCGKNAQISVAPDEIFVQFKNPETANYVVITTLSGQIIYSKTFNNVDEARIAAPRTKGIYIISVIDNKQITSEKFIK